MVKFNIALLVSGVFAAFAAAAPAPETSLFDRALKEFPSSVTCPVSAYLPSFVSIVL